MWLHLFGQDYNKRDFAGRFGAGLVRINNEAMLSLECRIIKCKPVASERYKHASPPHIAFSCLLHYSDGLGPSESEWFKKGTKNDWLETIMEMAARKSFTIDIGTYICIVTNC